MSSDSHITIGKFAKAYGVKGWIKVVSYTDPITNLIDYAPHWQVIHNNKTLSLDIEDAKLHGKFVIVKIKGYNAPETVRTFTNDLIKIAREDLPTLKDDEHYLADMIGLNVVSTSGVNFGKISEIQETGANDVIVVEGEKRTLIPYLDHVVLKINVDKQEMLVDWEDDYQ